MRRTWVVALLIASAACSKCSRKTAAGGIERRLPAGAMGYVVVPKLEQLGEAVKKFETVKAFNFAVQPSGFDTAQAYDDTFFSQWGFDPRSKEKMEKLGIFASGSAAVALMDERGAALLVLPVSDEARFSTFLQNFATQRLGAQTFAEVEKNGRRFHRALRGKAEILTWSIFDGFASIGIQESSEKVVEWVARNETDTLSKDENLKKSLARLPKGDLWFYVPPLSKPLMVIPVSHAVATMGLNDKELWFSADAPANPEQQGLWPASKESAKSLLRFLPGDAFLLARVSTSEKSVTDFAGSPLGKLLQRRLEPGGFNLAEALGQLKPSAVFSVSLSPTVSIANGLSNRDWRRADPFSFVHLVGVTQAKAADTLEPMLQKLASAAPSFGAKMEQNEGVFVTSYPGGEGIHLAAVKDFLLFGSPLERLKAVMKGDAQETTLPKETVATLESSPVAIVIDLQKLSDSVKALPDTAWGIGGFAIKASVSKWLEHTNDLSAITLNLDSKDGVGQVHFKLKFNRTP